PGTLTVSGGTLSVGSAANLGNPAGMTFQNNAALRTTGAVISGSEVNLAGGVFINTDGGDLTLAGQISGAGQLTKIGANTLTLTNINTSHTGSTVIQQGVLSVSADANLGA